MDSLSARIGCFFFTIGGLGVVLFLSSDLAQSPQLGYLCWGSLLMLIGFGLWRRNRPAPVDSGRFSVFRRKRESQQTPKK